MSDSCRSFRDDWLEAAPGGDDARAPMPAHRAECAACDAWCTRIAAQLRALGELRPLTAPPILYAATANEVESGSEARFARLISGLEPLAAPPELEARVADEGFYSAFLGRLTVFSAPAVLERLVSEELADRGARARRFAANLEPQVAPASLAERLRGWRSVPIARRSLAPLAALAAGLLVWLGVRAPWKTAEPRYAFRVRYADVSALDPLAAELGQALSGGAGLAVDPVPPGGAEAVR